MRRRGPILAPDMPAWTRPRYALSRPRAGRVIWTVLILALLLLVATRLDPLPQPLEGRPRVLDGDSLRLGGVEVRLFGLDAPEFRQTCRTAAGSDWSCGDKARTALRRLVGEAVTCRPLGRDRYGRSIGRCEAGGADVGSRLVAEGLAVSRGPYDAEEEAARSARRGLWQGAFTDPRDWRKAAADDPLLAPLDQLWTWLRELTGARNLR